MKREGKKYLDALNEQLHRKEKVHHSGIQRKFFLGCPSEVLEPPAAYGLNEGEHPAGQTVCERATHLRTI